MPSTWKNFPQSSEDLNLLSRSMDENFRSESDIKGSFSSFFSIATPRSDFIGSSDRISFSRQSSGYGFRTRSDIRCVVCGDTSSGKHYGVVACNGCSGFFKRSVRRKLVYRCQAARGKCIVDKAHRNQCQACRLRKCLECGMNRDAVQNERQPRNTATVRPEIPYESPGSLSEGASISNCGVRDVTVGAFPSLFTLHQKLVPPIFTKISPTKFCLSHINNKEGTVAEVSTEDEALKKEALYAFNYPCFITFEETAGPSMDSSKSSLYETSARILLLCIRWARNLPSYSSLDLQDQVALLESTWSELFLLGCIQWSLPMDSNPLFTMIETSQSLNNALYAKHLQSLQRTFARFKLLATDFSEFACLKAIVLFKPDAESLKDAHHVEMHRDHAQLMLAHHIKSQHFDYIFRFGRLLLLLPTLRQIPSDAIEAIFFSKTIGSIPMEKLLSDMFKC